MNDYFETTNHLKSLMPKQSISVSSINELNHAYIKKIKSKEPNRERLKNRIQSYREIDLSKMYTEIVLIDWNYVKTLQKSNKCPYCKLGRTTTKDHFIPTFYRKGIFYQKRKALTKKKLLIIKCCNSCNHKKGNLLPSEWLKIIDNVDLKDSKRNYNNDLYYLNVKETLMNILRMP